MLFAFLLLCLPSWSPLAQDERPDPVLPRITDPAHSPALGADGTPLVRGELPAQASPKARELFAKLNRSTWVGEEAPKPLHSFMVTFDARVRSTSTGSNDMRTTFLYLEEGRGFVRGIFPKSGRESVRGPEGDWLLDGKELLDLSDHSNRESRREHERWLALARNFATLSAPGGLRMARLEAPALTVTGPEVTIGAPTSLPIRFPTSAHAQRASQLNWLLMTTPDFDLFTAQGTGSPMRRVRLGLEQDTGRVRFALVESLRPGAQDQILVEIKSWITLGQRLLPRQMLVHRILMPQGPTDPLAPLPPPTRLSFEKRPGVDLYLVKDQSQPDVRLSPGDFAKPIPR